MNKDRILGVVMLVMAVLVLLNAINEYRALSDEIVLWSTYVMAYGGMVLAFFLGLAGVGMLRKK